MTYTFSFPQPYLNPVPKRKPGATLGISQGESNTGINYADTKGINQHKVLGHLDIITAGYSHYLPRELGTKKEVVFIKTKTAGSRSPQNWDSDL